MEAPVDATVGLAAGDDRNLFLLGSEIDCISIDSRAMLWSNGLSLESGEMLPLLLGNRLYVFERTACTKCGQIPERWARFFVATIAMHQVEISR